MMGSCFYALLFFHLVMAITCKSFPVERQTIKDNTAKETKSSRSCNSESIVTVVITKRTCKGKSYKQDSAWAWLMAICGLVCNIIVNGNVFCFGILNPVLLEEFQQGKARTGMAYRLVQLYS